MQFEQIFKQQFFKDLMKTVASSGLKILLILILTFVLVKLLRAIFNRLLRQIQKRHKPDIEFEKRTETLNSILNYVLTIVLVLVAAVMILSELGVEIGPLLAAAGVLGLAIGFGAQSLVKDIISGFFILLQDQIRVGDVVEVAGKAGYVERVNLKMTVLRDLEGKVHYIPNGEIAVVSNYTKEWSRYVFDIGVAYREDVDEVMQVMRDVDEALRNDPEFKDDILEPLAVLGLDKFGDSAIVIKAMYKTKPIKQWSIGRAYKRLLKKKFDELDIEIPFPHVTLWHGKDKQNQSPPMNIEVEQPKE